MLQPKKTKFRKMFRGKNRGKTKGGDKLSFGEFGLKAQGRGWLTATQLEAGRKALVHYLKRGGKVWIRVFPDKPVTHKSAGVRMGGGKGDISGYVAVIKPGRIIFEITGVEESVARKALEKAAYKLPFETKIVGLDQKI